MLKAVITCVQVRTYHVYRSGTSVCTYPQENEACIKLGVSPRREDLSWVSLNTRVTQN